MSILICPVCGKPLEIGEKTSCCENGHSFDRAKEGYFNFVLNGKPTSGDSDETVIARRDFLSGGYYDNLPDYLSKIIPNGVVVDACCGEGHFTEKLSKSLPLCDFYGFDLSKKAVKTASKIDKNTFYFIANIFSVPIADESADTVLHIFAPVCSDEIIRIMKPNGLFIHIFPGARHLWQLKEKLYDNPYENDETPDVSDGLKLVSSEKIKNTITVSGNSLKSLIEMTPYFFKTSKQRIFDFLSLTNELATETEFIINIYNK